MENRNILVGKWVCVTSYGPFRGVERDDRRSFRSATIKKIPFVSIRSLWKGVFFPTSIWFACHELELIGFPATILQ
jgi:hypothetical protein